MFKQNLKKPDGRNLYLYSTRPISNGITATAPNAGGEKPQPHMRWHPLRGEWVVYANHRQNRTFLPPKDFSPLAETKSTDHPTEMPAGDYEVAVFENLFPSFEISSQAAPDLAVPTAPANGMCEVVVFTKDPNESLGTLPVERIQLILEVIAERSREIGAKDGIQYVMPFENRGVEMGVTLHHPHGQIYAYPFLPPVIERMQTQMEEFYRENKRGLLSQILSEEIRDGHRVIEHAEGFAAFVPLFARYPYETWIAPERRVAYLHDLTKEEFGAFARVLKRVIQKHDGLWQRPQPYLLLMYQSPFDGKEHPEGHFHFELLPPYRTRDRLKYLAGTELGAGTFINDSIPEEKAAELRAVNIEERNENG